MKSCATDCIGTGINSTGIMKADMVDFDIFEQLAARPLDSKRITIPFLK